MASLGAFVFVFLAGLVTALATGLGAVPYFIVDDVSVRWRVALWGLASGIMVSASLFGLIEEGLAYGTPADIAPGLLAGVVLVVVANRVLERVGGHGHSHEDDDHDDGHDHGALAEAQATALADRDWRKLFLILGVLTVHSFPEGVAVGVSFAELGFEGGIPILGFSVPLLAVFMTIAISIHNVPEGLAVSIPLRALGIDRRWMVGAAVFSSLPQPIGAVIAYGFVTWAQEFMPLGFGFAAGAMIFLVLSEFIPEALDAGQNLPGRGHRELVIGVAAGVVMMAPLLVVQT
ncbi:MAG: ZIP family metal transporter [Halobacteriaceae archaeon]